MLRCRKCAYSLSDAPEPPERCPNCGTPTRTPEPERPLPVALGTVWRRAGASASGSGAVPAPEGIAAVPGASPGGVNAGPRAPVGTPDLPVPGDRPAGVDAAAADRVVPVIAGASAAASEPAVPAIAGTSAAASGPAVPASGPQGSGTPSPAAPARSIFAAPVLPPRGMPRRGVGEQAPPMPAAPRAFAPPPGLPDRRVPGPVAPPAPGAAGLVPPLPGLPVRPRGVTDERAPVSGDSRAPLATALANLHSATPMARATGPGPVLGDRPVPGGSAAPEDGSNQRHVPADRQSQRPVPEDRPSPRDGGPVPEDRPSLRDGGPVPEDRPSPEDRRAPPVDPAAVAPARQAPARIDVPPEPPVPGDRRDATDRSARPTFVVRDAHSEPDDLPAPVASSRPFTIPKVARRINVPAMTAVPSDLDSSSELDLPQLSSLTASASIETIVAPTRASGSTRPDDVDLDIDDLQGPSAATPPPRTPAPAAPASASGSAGRGGLRGPRPRPLHRLAPVVAQPDPPALAYVGLGALVFAFAGLWWFYFERGPGLRGEDPGASDMSSRTWPEGYIAAQDARLDADRVSEYRAALGEAEAHGDTLGRAEAALCIHMRYGPDLIRRSAAAVWRKQAGAADPRADRVAGLALLAVGAVAAAEALLASEDDARSVLYRALAAQQRGDHEAAARMAHEVLELRPGDAAAALVTMTATLAARRDTPLTDLQSAAAARPDHPLYQQALLRALLARGRLHAARSLADQQRPVAEAGDVYNAQLLVLQAEVAAAGGEARKARDLADSARSLAPQHLPTQLAQVRLLLAIGDSGRAQIELTPLLRASEDSEALVLQAELAIGAGNESAATRAVDRLAAVDDLGPAERRQLTLLRGRLHVMRGRSDDAASAFTAVLAESPDAAAAIALAELRVRIGGGEPLAAIVATEARLRDDPRELVRPQLRALRLAHANLLVETGRKDQAVAVLDAALLADPDDNAAQLRRGALAIEQGRGAAGRADLLAVFDRTGGYPGLIGPLGRLYLREGDLSQLNALLSPYAEDPQASDEVVVMNALLRLAQGDRDAADQNIDKVLQRSPSSWEAHLAKARVLYERERIPEAAAEIRLARPKVGDAEVELWTGKIAERAGKPQDALAAFRRARQLDPGQLEAGYLLGRTLLAQGLAREAVIELQAITRAPQPPAGAHLALGLALREREQLPEALQSFTRAIDHEPNPEEALYWAGRTAVELGRPAEGVPHLARAVLAGAGASWLADAHLWLGRAQHHVGHQGEARVALTRYLQLAGPKAPARAEAEKLLRER